MPKTTKRTKSTLPFGGGAISSESGELILSNLKEGILVVDEDFVITYANNRAAILLGKESTEEVVGGNYFTSLLLVDVDGNEIPKSERPVARAIATNQEVVVGANNPYYLVKSNGERIPVLIKVTPMFDGEATQGAVVVFHEFIKRDDSTADFISAASHQLRTPLAVANLHVDMLLAGYLGALTEAQREAIQEISFYNQKMAAVMAEFLTASRIELGTFSVVRKPTNLIDRAEAALRELAGDTKHKHITVVKTYEDNLPLVITDPEVMRMVFHHILANAIKFTDNGGTITLEIKKVRNKIVVNITDTGKGIEPEEQAHVFDRLQGRLEMDGDKTSKVSFGLYFVKTLLDLCTCEISLVSKVGKGTTFTIKIPMV